MCRETECYCPVPRNVCEDCLEDFERCECPESEETSWDPEAGLAALTERMNDLREAAENADFGDDDLPF